LGEARKLWKNKILYPMPQLNWPGKTTADSLPGEFVVDSVIYPDGRGYPEERPGDQLYLGDNLAVMSSLLATHEDRIPLIYADPPFFTNRRYPARVGRGEDSRRPQDWILVEGYPDHWPNIEAYLDMLYPRLVMMHRLLAPSGTFYLHLDWHANAYARVLLDEIFGPDRLLNEIVWVYHGPSPIRSAFNRKHDTILVYTKSKEYTFNVDDVRQPYDPSTVKTFASSSKAGFGKVPDLERGKVPEDWWYFPVVARLHSERTGYPTQKPEALLERIIRASSNPGDLVADFFCGAGTTATVAARLGRRYIVSDVNWRAVHTTRTRLVQDQAPPFMIYKGKQAKIPDAEASMARKLVPELSDRSLVLDESIASEIDYWEVDPEWDGVLFRSAVQGVRPRRKGSIPHSLDLPAAPGSVCVRFVTVNGERAQHLLSAQRT
jgi:DNA modification methylase